MEGTTAVSNRHREHRAELVPMPRVSSAIEQISESSVATAVSASVQSITITPKGTDPISITPSGDIFIAGPNEVRRSRPWRPVILSLYGIMEAATRARERDSVASFLEKAARIDAAQGSIPQGRDRCPCRPDADVVSVHGNAALTAGLPRQVRIRHECRDLDL